ncbi:DNA polymerase II [Saccharospirillum salsuginis]|uniref:DNA polymerase n=1 Tax=Saccharospirillum salsuginis TaxID=418750 RepID=A0A918NB85_9GAMM|nr:DNA polymerase II [Saccharospirillum salsuginis]GGX55676.1 DNA polymerase [Saccharospirillum salsuginis]
MLQESQPDPAFVLSRHWSETDNGLELRYWLKIGDDVRCWTLEGQESVCFIPEREWAAWHRVWATRPVMPRVGEPGLISLEGEAVRPVYSATFTEQRQWVRRGRDQQLRVWEDDVIPSDRFLMERLITASVTREGKRLRPASVEPKLRVVSLDIETAWYVPGQCPDLYSIAVVTEDASAVWVVDRGHTRPANAPEDLHWVDSEQACLEAFIDWVQAYDPDILVGWAVVDFDLFVLQQHADRHNRPLALGRDGSGVRWHKRQGGPSRVDIEGRQVVDGPGTLRSAAWYLDSYSLEFVSRTILGRGKAIEDSDDRVGEIERLYREEPLALYTYNREDAQLVIDIFREAKLWHFLVERAHLTGLTLDRIGASAAAFSYVYLPRLHRAGRVAPSVGEQSLTEHSPGGFVMDSKPGLYDDVLVLDFKSLYPSIIRTFLIDPLGLHRGLESPEAETVPGFLGARFHRTDHILPGIIDRLWAARDEAKREQNAPLSQSIKILMNSFYGVLGSNLCRFFDPRLASSITRRGHQILNESRDHIEQQGYRVIYGDTDSVFVWADRHPNPPELGQQLAGQLNNWWRQRIRTEFDLDCHLEMEFETHYRRFLMPTIRGLETGSKKRYAGVVDDGGRTRLVFKGLEAVRSDWTPLAKQFQQGLYQRVFDGADYAAYVREEVAALKAGQRDDRLTYQRRLRRPLSSYEKQKPPHVQAALKRKAEQPTWSGRQIAYRMTVNGVEPEPFVRSPLDYQHYLDKQLEPIADGILHFMGTSFRELIDEQMNLF